MNLKTIKNASDMKLDGVTFECEFRDKTLAAVTCTDKSGNLVRFVLENYAVRALVLAPAEKKTVHVVTGTVKVLGSKVREEFEEPYQASDRRAELESADVLDEVAVTVEEVEIPF